MLVVPSWKPLGMLRPCTTITQVVLESLSSSTFPRTEPFREAVSLTVSFSSSLKFAVNHMFIVSYSPRTFIVLLDSLLSDLLEKVNIFFFKKTKTTYSQHIFFVLSPNIFSFQESCGSTESWRKKLPHLLCSVSGHRQRPQRFVFVELEKCLNAPSGCSDWSHFHTFTLHSKCKMNYNLYSLT